MAEQFSTQSIGFVESCFGEKFATPRQSGIVTSAQGRVVFTPEVDPEACRGLEEFSHIWLVFVFDQVPEEDVRWLVRPPRLGGNEKKGVFATRSPYRPNRIGLSLVKLEKVTSEGVEVSGLDLVDGTPILDLKPYLPYVESVPDAIGGFAEKAPEKLAVNFPEELKNSISPEDVELIIETLAIDPRPAYHSDPNREYGCLLAGRNVKWRADETAITIFKIT
ncbi:tRNA (N6-threonylcarbamoyladenosine(37)-N6)-methyltransferase TrmO [Akkermansiaceae bacterium]|nr:tRNA (N6-threonylcarbamoyladenosine(37)-N6)-methyltransferase TrmO [Akkermansiaceae bacterium]MDB4716013.1 tRNA (N6-threonylcarbamoyladenosine(37)-N6)-methyltransferase TrmO [bacterium]MDB4284579.1 tRNA (N6-threonylcarbamoyladenosine(37)-N6)-methyltransferase TrmO [Akkermansiaceae bacterium]MDB4333432.1 tRNA (N6-threonylcarbamoyladenosine(37)-N6)-methyltransferase TrmO [Akkermansiaceae bacterium]MDB4451798.1 tRNA (N6-threonylcarbamoyladenosine(37)-N6)-methyltransferase TrmO [Akkermansiaceae 